MLPLMRTEHHLSGGHRPCRLQIEGSAAGVRGELAVLHCCTHLQPPLPPAALKAALRMPFTNQAAAVHPGQYAGGAPSSSQSYKTHRLHSCCWCSQCKVSSGWRE